MLITPEKKSEMPVAMPALPEPQPSAEPAIANIAETHLSRRQFLARTAALVTTVAVGDCVNELANVEVTKHLVPMRGLRSPMRIVQLSDLHRSWCVPESYIARIVDMTNALKPDLIALTGDYVTRDSEYIHSCAAQIARLNAPMGMYGILGNHDYAADAYRGGPIVAEALAYTGVHLLIDRNERLDNGLRLVGVNDITTQTPHVDDGFAGVGRDEPVVVMTHNPQMWDGLQDRDCVVLTGHTHGGQINLPVVTKMVHPDRTYYLKGWFTKPDSPSRLYVSRGLGTVFIPLRFRSRPEIALFDLVPT